MNFTNSFTGFPLSVHLLQLESISQDSALNFSNNSLKTQYFLNSFEVDNLTVASGQPFNFTIFFTDSYNQLLLFDNEAKSTLSCLYINSTMPKNKNYSNSSDSENFSIYIEKNTAQSQKGIISFIDVNIIFQPGVDFQCQIQTKYDDTVLVTTDYESSSSNNRTLNISIFIHMRNCSKGEILLEDNSCFVCETPTFSVIDPMDLKNSKKECLLCPDNAYCIGGNNILPQQGNWRSSLNSSLILECPTQESCEGSSYFSQQSNYNISDEGFVQGICHPNYWGNLCYMCQKGFGRLNEMDNCEKCSEQLWPYFKIIIGLSFIIIYVFIQAKVYANVKSDKANLAILLKLFLNHFQIVAMVSLTDLGWTADFQSFFSFQEYLSCLYQNFFTIDCLVQEINQDLLSQKIIFTILLPVILCLIMLLIWLIDLCIRTRKHDQIKKISYSFCSNLRVAFLSIIFIFYPEILKKCFLLLNCLLVDDSNNESVLKDSPNIICWGSDHILWILTISLPGILIWGILTPLFLLITLCKYKKEIAMSFREKEAKNPTLKQNKEILIKNIALTIDLALKKQLFKEIELPKINKVTYQFGNQIISEIIVVDVLNSKSCVTSKLKELTNVTNIPEKENPFLKTKKSQEEILKTNKSDVNTKNPEIVTNSPEIPPLLKESHNKNDIQLADSPSKNIQDEDFLITNPEALFKYLYFIENLDKSLIDQKYLGEHPPHVKISNFKEYKRKQTRLGVLKSTELNKSKSIDIIEFKEENSFIFANLGFIYKGYNSQNYYWEILLFSRKFLLIFIGVLTELFPKTTRDLNLVIILMFYFVVQIKYEPYELDCFNYLEVTSIIIAITTTFIGILLYSDVIKESAVFFLILVFLINFLYLAIWCYYLVKIGGLRQVIERISTKIKNLKKKIQNLHIF